MAAGSKAAAVGSKAATEDDGAAAVGSKVAMADDGAAAAIGCVVLDDRDTVEADASWICCGIRWSVAARHWLYFGHSELDPVGG